ncbi:hypothetical protein PAEPH01_0677 [Pancytospora epiphaga]|nr:hypothetical protein PAEPH01_0677 [Pancytospora epiphaga]
MHFYACENEKMQLAIAEYKGEIKKRREHLEKMRVAKEDSVERRSLISKYRQLKARMEEVEKLRWAADNCSVSQYKDMERQMEDTKKNINKVMDDIFSLQSYVCNKCNMDKKEFNSAFGLKEDMDYVE